MRNPDISLYGRYEIDIMREAGQLVARCHKALQSWLSPGQTTLEVDAFVEAFLNDGGMRPAQKGFQGYPFASCTSVNDEICHGFPTEYVLREGDLLTVDMVAEHRGLHADSAWSYVIGDRQSDDTARLMAVTREALALGLRQVVVGHRLSDIGAAIERYVVANGFSVVRAFTGHGIGYRMHEPPQVDHVGPAGRGPKLKRGMVLTVEPMVTVGHEDARVDANGWTARTVDGSLAAQFEHTVALTPDGIEILTELKS